MRCDKTIMQKTKIILQKTKIILLHDIVNLLPDKNIISSDKVIRIKDSIQLVSDSVELVYLVPAEKLIISIFWYGTTYLNFVFTHFLQMAWCYAPNCQVRSTKSVVVHKYRNNQKVGRACCKTPIGV